MKVVVIKKIHDDNLQGIIQRCEDEGFKILALTAYETDKIVYYTLAVGK